jgi:cell fate (sporulation/competence/biofilm development) regulator YlbF (YheA/YmcA/DUF963 family)
MAAIVGDIGEAIDGSATTEAGGSSSQLSKPQNLPSDYSEDDEFDSESDPLEEPATASAKGPTRSVDAGEPSKSALRSQKITSRITTRLLNTGRSLKGTSRSVAFKDGSKPGAETNPDPLPTRMSTARPFSASKFPTLQESERDYLEDEYYDGPSDKSLKSNPHLSSLSKKDYQDYLTQWAAEENYARDNDEDYINRQFSLQQKNNAGSVAEANNKALNTAQENAEEVDADPEIAQFKTAPPKSTLSKSLTALRNSTSRLNLVSRKKSQPSIRGSISPSDDVDVNNDDDYVTGPFETEQPGEEANAGSSQYNPSDAAEDDDDDWEDIGDDGSDD